MSFDYSLASLNFALFWISRWSSSTAGWEPSSVEPQLKEGRGVRLSNTSLCLKRLVSSQVIGVKIIRGEDAEMPCQTALSHARCATARAPTDDSIAAPF